MADIEFEIDGKKLTAQPGQTVMQVADAAGIYIPRFCYHKHLSIAANCRMCLVEVEKSPKTLPACATPVAPGMKVFTQSEKTIDAQRAVMSFLLINHPLDCPICDQGGECELQDLSMGYGSCHSHYDEPKRSIADQDLGPLIATDMTRCIYCTRCVRFGAEVAGVREMGGTYRGEDTEIGTYIQHAIHSEVSGNIIDLCPVGALTSKPFRFTARAWELEQAPSISPHDCLGSNLNVHTRYGKVMRVVTRENAQLNETWLSDRDRFSYTGLYHPERLEEPLIKINGSWQVADWKTALNFAAEGIRAAVAEFGQDKFGALASPSATLEEFYLLQKLTRGLGSPHVDHRLRECDTSDQDYLGAFPGLGQTDQLFASDVILLIGSNLQKEVPLLATKLRQAALDGKTVIAINALDYDFNFTCKIKNIIATNQWVATLKAIANKDTNKDVTKEIIDNLRGKLTVLLGAQALHHPNAASLRYLAQRLAKQYEGQCAIITDGANGAGGWLAGAVPHRHAGGEAAHVGGLSAHEMLEKPRKVYLLLNVDPNLDTNNAYQANSAMQQAKFVVALSIFKNEILNEHAHVILPMAPFTETSGTYVNGFGDKQSFKGIANSFGASRPAWKILRALANFLHLDGFEYNSSEEVKHEVYALIDKQTVQTNDYADFNLIEHESNEQLTRVGEIPIYAIDSLVRHAQPLQATQVIMEGNLNAVRMHPETAYRLNLKESDNVNVKQHHATANLPVMFDARIALDGVWIPGGVSASQNLGSLFGNVEIKRV